MTPPPVTAPTATATAEPTAIRLSERVRLALAIEGPAPLEVDWPAPSELLGDVSAANWDLTLATPATVEAVAGQPGRERAGVAYFASPRRPGTALPLGFRPVPVRSGAGGRAEVVAPPILSIDVTASVAADVAQLRPGSGFAAPAEMPAPGPTGYGLWWLAGAAILGVGAAVWRWVRQRRAGRTPPDTRLDALRLSGLPDAAWAALMADYVRGEVHTATGLPARERTTEELARLASEREIDLICAVRLLAECDRVRFAGAALSPDERYRIWREAATMLPTELAIVAATRPAAHGPNRSAG